ncbi:MAG TPA: biosynthetic-type acetolactate synthase large subunit [Thermoanaerobaculia bacterium]|nr:biosynthetic-type acetolactate synthase large subunit [Thermoanaerobaculia bacterium]
MSAAFADRRRPAPRRVADALAEELVRLGVTHLFGHPGGAALPLYDALSTTPGLTHVLMRHEQGAAHAAEGYARATGRVGVCLATSGPGATNLITGLADAYMDSTPIVAITAQVATHLIGRDGFQEADVLGLTQPVTKHNWIVKEPRDVVPTIRRAFALARSGRPGPVLVDIPRDTLQAPALPSDDPREPSPRPPRPAPGELRRAADAISRSRRPVLYAGGGVIASDASEELRCLAHETRIPVTTTLMAKGVYPETDPLSLGMLGMHGTAYANHAMNESDLIVAVGARFDDRITGKLSAFAPHARVIHVDVDEAEIHKNRRADFPLLGDAADVLRDLIPLVTPPDVGAWLRTIAEWKARWPLRFRVSETILPQLAIDRLWRITRGLRPVLTTDVGQHQMWAAQLFLCDEPRSFITSGGLGTMGYGLPAALGAQCGLPGRLVVNLNGDGSFQQTMQTLISAAEARLPIKVVVLDNGGLGMVRQWQELFYEERFFSVELKNPDFARVAEALGAVGLSARRPDELDDVYRRALEVKDRPVVVDVHCDPRENCYPMWPAGQAIDSLVAADPRHAKGEPS